MRTVLLTLTGAVIASVLADTIISSTGMKKMAQLAIGIAVSTILITPVVAFLSDEGNLELTAPAYNEGYLEITDGEYLGVISSSAEYELLERGYNVDISLAVHGGKVCDVVAVCDFAVDKTVAEEVGNAVSGVLSVPIWEIVVKSK